MKNQTYGDFWQKIHSSARRKGIPLRVMFELTYRCNFKCRHCYVPQGYGEKGELKTEGIFSILDQLKDLGCFYLGFTGGEPFMRRDILDVLRYAKRCGFEVIVYSNGSLIDKSMIKELKGLRLNKIDITIPAMSKGPFEKITGAPGSCGKVFKTIELLHKNGINLGFKTCLLKESEKEIERIQDFAKSVGALHRLDDRLSRRLDGSGEPFKYRGGSRRMWLSDNCHCEGAKRPKQSQVSNHKSQIENLFKCGVGESQVAITPQGELKMCLMIDYPKYKISETSLKGAWRKLKELVKSIKPDKNYKCNTCELELYCKWCPGKSWLAFRDFTSCDPDNRAWLERQFTRKEQYA